MGERGAVRDAEYGVGGPIERVGQGGDDVVVAGEAVGDDGGHRGAAGGHGGENMTSTSVRSKLAVLPVSNRWAKSSLARSAVANVGGLAQVGHERLAD